MFATRGSKTCGSRSRHSHNRQAKRGTHGAPRHHHRRLRLDDLPTGLLERHAFVRVTALSSTQACRTYKLPVPNPFRSPLDN